MLFKKLWRTMGLYRAQFISMILMITLGVGVFFGFNMEWYSIEQNTEEYFDKTGFADYRIVAESGVSREDAEKIAAISGVEAVSRFLSVTADVKEQAGDSVALTVTENAAVSGMLPADGAEYDAASKDGIWLSKKYAEANGVSLGDTLTFSFRGIEISGRVAGLIRSVSECIVITPAYADTLRLSYLIVKLASEFEMRVYITARSYIISVLLTFGVSMIVSLMVARKNKKINMVEALKAAE